MAGITVIVAVACSATTSSKPASATCVTDSDCSTGACLDLSVMSADGGCSSAGKACSRSCTNDVDCAVLGPKFMCFAGCGATKTCGATP